MNNLVRAKCGNCGKRADCAVASRSGGGSYRRAPRAYRTRICVPCARELLATVRRGQSSTDRWEAISLLWIVREADGWKPGDPIPPAPWRRDQG